MCVLSQGNEMLVPGAHHLKELKGRMMEANLHAHFALLKM